MATEPRTVTRTEQHTPNDPYRPANKPNPARPMIIAAGAIFIA